jgi:hypothetical protein
VWRQYCKRYGYLPEDIFNFFGEKEYRSFVITSGSQIMPVDSASYPGRGNVLFIPAEEVSVLHLEIAEKGF